jgi:TRAP-type uncharacterized transport system fused permease subunit
MVSLLVPAIVKLGAVAPAAHMFAFYFAILSAITPPVALAVFAAATLAKADLWRSGLEAMRIAAPTYLVPFLFVYSPALLMIGDPATIATAAVTGVMGVFAFSTGLQGYLVRECLWWERVLLIAAALTLIKPGLVTDAIGLALLALVWGLQKAQARRGLSADHPGAR